MRRSGIHGLGGFALVDIARRTRLAEYTGERISPAEADTRYTDVGSEDHRTYLFTVDEETVVDAGVGGNDSRFINHSCAPNCRAVVEDGRIYVDAIKDIPANAELTYDYRLIIPGPWQPEWDSLYVCRCGAPTCRGTMLLRRWRKIGRRK